MGLTRGEEVLGTAHRYRGYGSTYDLQVELQTVYSTQASVLSICKTVTASYYLRVSGRFPCTWVCMRVSLHVNYIRVII